MKIKMFRQFWLVLGLLLFVSTFQVGAVTLSLSPPSQTATPGNTVSLDLTIGGLGNFAPDSLGDFDVDIRFDPNRLSFQSYSLGGLLGDVGLVEALDNSSGDVGGGIVDLAEVSLLTPVELDSMQPESFVLATLDFLVDVLPTGTSTTVSIDTGWVLGDAFGSPLTVDTTGDAVIRNPNGGTAPAPATLVLLGLGVAVFGVQRRRQVKTV